MLPLLKQNKTAFSTIEWKGIKFADPKHNIFGVKEKGKYKYTNISTAAYGKTVFWRYGDLFLQATGNRLINRLLTVVSLSLLLLCTAWSSVAVGVEFSSAGWQRLCKRIFTATPSVRAVKGGFKSLSIEGTPELPLGSDSGLSNL
jgi:hypothetical protein